MKQGKLKVEITDAKGIVTTQRFNTELEILAYIGKISDKQSIKYDPKKKRIKIQEYLKFECSKDFNNGHFVTEYDEGPIINASKKERKEVMDSFKELMSGKKK